MSDRNNEQVPCVVRKGNYIDMPVFSAYGKRKDGENIGVGDRMVVTTQKYRYKFSTGVWVCREEAMGREKNSRVLFFEKISDMIPEQGSIAKAKFSQEERNRLFEHK